MRAPREYSHIQTLGSCAVGVAVALHLLVTGCTDGTAQLIPSTCKPRPLVQAGSANLLPRLSEGLDGWDRRGRVTATQVDAAMCLRIEASGAEQASRVLAAAGDVREGVLYRLGFDVKMTPDTELDWAADYAGLTGWLTARGGGRTLEGAVRIEELRRADAWLPAEYRIFTPPGTEQVTVTMELHATTGTALIRDIELVQERVDAAEERVILQTPSGDWAEVTPAAGAAAPGQPILWVPGGPDELLPRSTPTQDDLQRPLELYGTPGEMCVGMVGLTSPGPLTGVTLTAGEPSGAQGGLVASPEVLAVQYRARRTDFYGRGNTFHYVADTFSAAPPGIDIPPGRTGGFRVKLRIPPGAKPGTYESALQASVAGLSVPVRVTVYPFAPADLGERVMHLYADAGRWETMTDERVLAELADIADHGYNSISLGCRGTARMEGNTVTAYQLAEPTVRAARLLLQSGLAGPVLVYTGNVPEQLAQQMGLQRGITREVHADQWPPQLAVAMVQALKLIREEYTRLGISDPVMVAVDEPGYWKEGSPERLLWDVSVARQAGWKVFDTSSYLPSDPLGQGLDYHCYGGRQLFMDGGRARQVSEATRASGQKLWYYCTGAYSGQVGNMARNRYLAGFFFHRCGADGTASWTFQRPRGDAFDDFLADERTGRRETGQACITYPDPARPGANLDTPQWEGLRQAFYDHRYALTMQQAIERLRKTDPAAADAAQKHFDALLDTLPWNGYPHKWSSASDVSLSAVRRQIAEMIVEVGG